MNRVNNLVPRISFPLANLVLLSSVLVSCSWVDKSVNKLLGRRERPKRVSTTVSRAQYNELLRKYERLKNKYEGSATSEVVSNHNTSTTLLQDLNDTKLAPSAQPKKPVVETVDVFGDKGLVSQAKKSVPTQSSKPQMIKPIVMASNLSVDETNQEVGKYQQGVVYLHQKKNDLALRVFQELEKSKLAQVRVRSKFQIGQLLYNQGEYDLALQVYEDIVQTSAFSGVVIDSLRQMVSCSQKLNLVEKREKYKSLLKDVFGA